MAEQHSAEQVLPSATSQRGGRQNQQRGHGRRRGRGRGGSGQPSEPSASANRDIVSQGESVHQGASVGQRGLSEATSRHIGASRRSRAGRQAVAHRGSSKPDGQPIRRQFGGHLTSTPSEHLSSEILATLSGNAPEFVPGQALQTRGYLALETPKARLLGNLHKLTSEQSAEAAQSTTSEAAQVYSK